MRIPELIEAIAFLNSAENRVCYHESLSEIANSKKNDPYTRAYAYYLLALNPETPALRGAYLNQSVGLTREIARQDKDAENLFENAQRLLAQASSIVNQRTGRSVEGGRPHESDLRRRIGKQSIDEKVTNAARILSEISGQAWEFDPQRKTLVLRTGRPAEILGGLYLIYSAPGLHYIDPNNFQEMLMGTPEPRSHDLADAATPAASSSSSSSHLTWGRALAVAQQAETPAEEKTPFKKAYQFLLTHGVRDAVHHLPSSAQPESLGVISTMFFARFIEYLASTRAFDRVPLQTIADCFDPAPESNEFKLTAIGIDLCLRRAQERPSPVATSALAKLPASPSGLGARGVLFPPQHAATTAATAEQVADLLGESIAPFVADTQSQWLFPTTVEMPLYSIKRLLETRYECKWEVAEGRLWTQQKPISTFPHFFERAARPSGKTAYTLSIEGLLHFEAVANQGWSPPQCPLKPHP